MSTNLNETQHQAIVMLASGKTGAAVADALGVRKETVSRWRQLPEFRAGLNEVIEEVRESTRHRLTAMVEKALEVIEADLQTIDDPVRRSRAAFKILQLVGVNSFALPAEPLPIDPEAIRAQDEKEKMFGAFNLL